MSDYTDPTGDNRADDHLAEIRAKIEPGTVSHGTLITNDLIEAFTTELERLDPIAAAKLAGCYGEIRSDEEDGWYLECLFDTLGDLAPEGLYFGAHEGDGSDFGFWHVLDED